MVVASAQANVLWLLGLMDACVRVLIGVARSVEVTPDKLARRYPEVTPVTGPSHPMQQFLKTHDRSEDRLCCLLRLQPFWGEDLSRETSHLHKRSSAFMPYVVGRDAHLLVVGLYIC